MNKPELIIQIDDDEINNFINESLFKSKLKNVNVKSFTDPNLAIEFIKNEFASSPISTIVFLDINMPEMSGWELIEELKSHFNIIKEYMTFYIISSSIDSIDKSKSKDHPLVKDFVSKPLSTKSIKEIFGI
jgi:response regulator RpfG family c-di-GMP phosphodiesterase